MEPKPSFSPARLAWPFTLMAFAVWMGLLALSERFALSAFERGANLFINAGLLWTFVGVQSAAFFFRLKGFVLTILLTFLMIYVASQAPGAGLGSIALFLSFTLAAYSAWSHTAPSPTALLSVFIVGVGANLIVNRLAIDSAGSVWILSFGLALSAFAGGESIGRKIESFGHVGAVTIVMSLVDLWSVLAPGGWTGDQIEKHQAGVANMLGYFLVWIPIPGDPTLHPFLGAVDLLFAAFFIAVSRRFGKPTYPTLAAIFWGLMAAMMLGLWFGIAIPALPLMGIAYLCAEPSCLILPKSDRRAVGLFLAGLVLALAFLSWLRLGTSPTPF